MSRGIMMPVDARVPNTIAKRVTISMAIPLTPDFAIPSKSAAKMAK